FFLMFLFSFSFIRLLSSSLHSSSRFFPYVSPPQFLLIPLLFSSFLSIVFRQGCASLAAFWSSSLFFGQSVPLRRLLSSALLTFLKGHTISLAFNRVLRKVCKLGLEIISPTNMYTIPMEIISNSKYYPFFKDCIGAIDGTHVPTSIPQNEQIPFRRRKTNTTWNIMWVCSFDMLFTYVMSGWKDRSMILAYLLNV
ncbi:hypothetical protein Csa_017722, partial [Cucumis sativus]